MGVRALVQVKRQGVEIFHQKGKWGDTPHKPHLEWTLLLNLFIKHLISLQFIAQCIITQFFFHKCTKTVEHNKIVRFSIPFSKEKKVVFILPLLSFIIHEKLKLPKSWSLNKIWNFLIWSKTNHQIFRHVKCYKKCNIYTFL